MEAVDAHFGFTKPERSISPERMAPGLRSIRDEPNGRPRAAAAAQSASSAHSVSALGVGRRRESVDDMAGTRFRFKDLIGNVDQQPVLQGSRREPAAERRWFDALIEMLTSQLAKCAKSQKFRGADALRRLSIRRLSIGSELLASLDKGSTDKKGGGSAQPAASGSEARSRVRAQHLLRVLEIVGERVSLAPDELLVTKGATQQGNDAMYVVRAHDEARTRARRVFRAACPQPMPNPAPPFFHTCVRVYILRRRCSRDRSWRLPMTAALRAFLQRAQC